MANIVLIVHGNAASTNPKPQNGSLGGKSAASGTEYSNYNTRKIYSL